MASSVLCRPNALRAAMAARKMSTRAFEDNYGVSRSTVSNANRGRPIKRETAEMIAKALDIPARQLFIHSDGATLSSNA